MKKREKVIIYLLATILIIVALGIYLLGFIDFKSTTYDAKCRNSLMLISHAKGVDAIKNDKKTGDKLNSEEVAEHIDGGMPVCPKKGKYTINPIGTASTCSYHTPNLPSKPSETKAEE